ncbi:hypothetical protein BH23CHL8_BH23CHL8_10690 [soil metagenome]
MNPPESFATLYTAMDEATGDAELDRQLARSGLTQDALRARELAAIRVRLHRVLDLRDPAVLAALGIKAEDLLTDEVELTRAIGEAAQHPGYEAVIAPSAARVDGAVVAMSTDGPPPGRTESGRSSATPQPRSIGVDDLGGNVRRPSCGPTSSNSP